MDGLAWLSLESALDMLRVGEENAPIVEELAKSVPAYVEALTGYPAFLTKANPDEVVKPLARFVLQLWYNPDGTDGERLEKVVESLAKSVKALVSAGAFA